MLSVLIVDDEAYVCDGIENNIPWDEFGIGNIHQAHTGREGLAIAEHLKPDIIISDVRMPHMDGLDMASALQEMGIQPQIIFMSAYSELSCYKKALKLHAVSFVEKPIILEELYAEIRHAVERIRAARGPRLSEEELRAYGLGSLLRGGNAPAAVAFRKRLAGFNCYTLCDVRCATAMESPHHHRYCRLHPGIYFVKTAPKENHPHRPVVGYLTWPQKADGSTLSLPG